MDPIVRGYVESPGGAYRYRLERDVQPEGIVAAFFGVNPSTADAERDDATVRKWNGFAKRLGVRRYMVGNVFALRATNVALLRLHQPLVCFGDGNHATLKAIIQDADLLVPCWGSTDKLSLSHRDYVHAVKDMLLSSGKPVRTWGLTKSGDPKHPLMLPYSTRLREWRQ